MEHPRVFVSHASEDKERFVIDFATKLRSQQGLDAFVDTWEILPGDSLVQRIFDEGIGQADAVIVVISKYSINKPWVLAELNVSKVREIEDGIRLTPVVIDDIGKDQIPMSLRATVWQRISDLANYDAELSKVVDAIYGHRERPPLGQPPEYIRADFYALPGLSSSDSMVLKLCCEMELQSGTLRYDIESEDIMREAEYLDLHPSQVAESFEILAGRSYIEALRTTSTVPYSVRVADHAFDEYGRAYLPGYDQLVRSVALEIVNSERRDGDEIATAIDSPLVLIERILVWFEVLGYIVLFYETGSLSIQRVSPELRRWLQETE